MNKEVFDSLPEDFRDKVSEHLFRRITDENKELSTAYPKLATILDILALKLDENTMALKQLRREVEARLDYSDIFMRLIGDMVDLFEQTSRKVLRKTIRAVMWTSLLFGFASGFLAAWLALKLFSHLFGM